MFVSLHPLRTKSLPRLPLKYGNIFCFGEVSEDGVRPYSYMKRPGDSMKYRVENNKYEVSR